MDEENEIIKPRESNKVARQTVTKVINNENAARQTMFGGMDWFKLIKMRGTQINKYFGGVSESEIDFDFHGQYLNKEDDNNQYAALDNSQSSDEIMMPIKKK